MIFSLKNKRIALLANVLSMSAVLALSVACAPNNNSAVNQHRKVINLQYTEDMVAPYNISGKGSLNGQAFLRQQGGGVVTCAGEDVRVLPDVAPTREGNRGIAQGDIVNYLSDGMRVSVKWPKAFRTGTCDADGRFSFSGLADGRWSVMTIVQWRVGYREQGGVLQSFFEVKNGSSIDLILTDKNRIEYSGK